MLFSFFKLQIVTRIPTSQWNTVGYKKAEQLSWCEGLGEVGKEDIKGKFLTPGNSSAKQEVPKAAKTETRASNQTIFIF